MRQYCVAFVYIRATRLLCARAIIYSLFMVYRIPYNIIIILQCRYTYFFFFYRCSFHCDITVVNIMFSFYISTYWVRRIYYFFSRAYIVRTIILIVIIIGNRAVTPNGWHGEPVNQRCGIRGCVIANWQQARIKGEYLCSIYYIDTDFENSNYSST